MRAQRTGTQAKWTAVGSRLAIREFYKGRKLKQGPEVRAPRLQFENIYTRSIGLNTLKISVILSYANVHTQDKQQSLTHKTHPTTYAKVLYVSVTLFCTVFKSEVYFIKLQKLKQIFTWFLPISSFLKNLSLSLSLSFFLGFSLFLQLNRQSQYFSVDRKWNLDNRMWGVHSLELALSSLFHTSYTLIFTVLIQCYLSNDFLIFSTKIICIFILI